MERQNWSIKMKMQQRNEERNAKVKLQSIAEQGVNIGR